jgi:hypothetical protein
MGLYVDRSSAVTEEELASYGQREARNEALLRLSPPVLTVQYALPLLNSEISGEKNSN